MQPCLRTNLYTIVYNIPTDPVTEVNLAEIYLRDWIGREDIIYKGVFFFCDSRDWAIRYLLHPLRMESAM